MSELVSRTEPLSKDGTPDWAYDEDGYCVCCGNGAWKYHMPDCELRDALDVFEQTDCQCCNKRIGRNAESGEWFHVSTAERACTDLLGSELARP